MKLTSFFGDDKQKAAAYRLYASLVKKSRQPEFYTNFGVNDTLECRFEMIVVHAFLVLRRLKRDHDRTAGIAQDIFDIMFADMDQSLRETGVGDMSIGKRIKAMVGAFYGRIAAYDNGLDSRDSTVIGNALRRNLFRNMTPRDDDVERMAHYIRRCADVLDTQETAALLSGEVEFATQSGDDVIPRSIGIS